MSWIGRFRLWNVRCWKWVKILMLSCNRKLIRLMWFSWILRISKRNTWKGFRSISCPCPRFLNKSRGSINFWIEEPTRSKSCNTNYKSKGKKHEWCRNEPPPSTKWVCCNTKRKSPFSKPNATISKRSLMISTSNETISNQDINRFSSSEISFKISYIDWKDWLRINSWGLSSMRRECQLFRMV